MHDTLIKETWSLSFGSWQWHTQEAEEEEETELTDDTVAVPAVASLQWRIYERHDRLFFEDHPKTTNNLLSSLQQQQNP